MSEESTPFVGKDLFGRAIVAVRGKSGSAIIRTFPDEPTECGSDDEDCGGVISLSAESVIALAKWVGESNAE